MIEFDNYLYKKEHDILPRGLGHWAFIVDIKDDKLTELNCPLEHYRHNNTFSLIWASDVMMLSDAKKELRNWLWSKGIIRAYAYVAD